ncbi:MAG: inositol monophosphatase [Zetaproteobacteria bacterium CG2_30_46_52]|nr:MAG: inositol monophosphatase [Zetaproteobacteria bacterium CG2_30_46_52]
MKNLLLAVEKMVHQAGNDILLPAFISQTALSTIKTDGSIVTETDQKSQDFLQAGLAQLDDSIGFLGEEMSHEAQLACLQQGGRFWCVDPLDGTGNFATPMPLFAISVALISGGKPVLACIYDPIRDEMVSAIAGAGLFFNGQRVTSLPSPRPLAQSIGFIDFKRLKPETAAVVVSKGIYRSQRNLGSCALEWAWLALGRSQFVIHGGEKLWDYAAGLLLAEEAGCPVTDFANLSPFAQARLSSSILATSDSQLHKEWAKILFVDVST